MQLVCQKYPDIKLTIAGGGKPSRELEWKRVQLGISKQVVFLGRIPHEQIPEIYQQHDVFVSATAQEGMSNAMLEAMASGLPIITTHCEGVDELIDGNGLVVDKDDVNKIAEAIIRLAEDTKTYTKMSIAARKRAMLFSWSFAADQYITSYRRILWNKKGKLSKKDICVHSQQPQLTE
jgi:glycosyltransferase involved in cell wall biosynthesis